MQSVILGTSLKIFCNFTPKYNSVLMQQKKFPARRRENIFMSAVVADKSDNSLSSRNSALSFDANKTACLEPLVSQILSVAAAASFV